MRILLTGSSGWLGRHLAPRLVALGHEVIGLDVAPGPQTQVVGSVADRRLIDEVFQRNAIQAVIHSAALHKPDIVRYPASEFVSVNVQGTLNLLEAAVAAGHDRFVFTSTTSLMISRAIRAGAAGGLRKAAWITEAMTGLAPRNIYGVTKLAAEHLCRLYHQDHGLPVMVLRTARFFPEDDDQAHLTEREGLNTKANEFLYRRLTVEDAAEAHVLALDRAPELGFERFILSAPSPFQEADCEALIGDAPAVVERYFPGTLELYARHGWTLPSSVDRVYVTDHAQKLLGFRCRTRFQDMLAALAQSRPPPVIHDPDYLSPKERRPGEPTGKRS